MKKENRQLARERRAQEREKEARRRTARHVLTYWGPIVLSVVVVVVLIAAIATSGGGDGSSSDSADLDDSYLDETEETEEEYSEFTDEDDSEFVIHSDEEDLELSTEEGLTAELGDTVNIDFTGYVDGEPFEGGDTAGAGYDLTLGSHAFIDGFEDGVVGHKVGETFDLNLQFPDPYPNDPTLAGKDVVFTTTLNGIYE